MSSSIILVDGCGRCPHFCGFSANGIFRLLGFSRHIPHLPLTQTVKRDETIDRNYQRVGIERARELWQMTLDCGIAHYEAELCWLEQALKRVRNLPPLTPSKTLKLNE